MEAILLQVILIGLNAVFASAEIAVISMNDTKLERMARDGDARAKRLAALTAQPTKFLSAIFTTAKRMMRASHRKTGSSAGRIAAASRC